MQDRQFRVEGKWSLASDGYQWILQYRGRGVSFVHSTRDVLARCMRDKDCGQRTAEKLLDGLPDTFEAWKSSGGQFYA